MSLVPQVGAVCKSVHYYLHIIGRIRCFLTRQAGELLVHALVTSRMDMYNGLLIGLPRCLTKRIQRCQNVVARIVTCEKCACHITPIFFGGGGLHWLPVLYRVQFKVLLHVYRALHGMSPAYISELLHSYTPGRCLRSADSYLLQVPRTKTKWGDRAFSKAGPSLWNDLPLRVTASPSLSIFKNHLKTLLFERAYM